MADDFGNGIPTLFGDRSVQLIALLILGAFGLGFAAGPASPVGFVDVGAGHGGEHSGHSEHGGHAAHSEHDGSDKAAKLPSGAPTVRVELDEFVVRLSRRSVPAGPVRFTVKNRGAIEHELMIVPLQDLRRLGADPSADALHEVVAMSIHGVLPDATPSTRGTRLKPGTYVVLCNLPGHLSAGQRTTLVVS